MGVVMERLTRGVRSGSLCAMCALVLSACALRSVPGSNAQNVTLGSCSPSPCVNVSLGAVPAIGAVESSEVEGKLRAEIMAVLYAPVDIEGNDPTPDNLVKEIQERLDDYSRVSSAPIEWKLTRQANVVHQNSDVMAVEVLSEGYLGGAHGFTDKTLMTFDVRTGARLGVSDVVEDGARTTLSKIVEAEFRRTRNIAGSTSLQEAGFFILPGQEMPLAENFALTGRGLELQYNPYEVGPYSMGPTRVVVPREAIEPLLTASLKGACGTASSESVR